jgi:hypothetical protein
VAAPAAVTGMLLFDRRWKDAAGIVGIAVISLSAYMAYGFLYDKAVFLDLWRLQLARYDMRFDSIFQLFRDPLIADRWFVDGWVYFGWASMLLVLTRDMRRNLPVVLGFAAYFAVYAFAIPGEPLHGWYRYPFYPFLAISIALFLKEYFGRNHIAMAAFFTVTGLSMLSESWGKVYGFSYWILRGYLFLVVSASLPSVVPQLSKYTGFRWMRIALIVSVVMLTAWATLTYNEQ